MAKVVVFGFTGYAGGAITAELLSRGHSVVGVARNAAAEAPTGVEVRTGSIFDEALVADVAQGADHIVVALRAQSDPLLITALPALSKAAIAEGARLSFVGGAGSLNVTEGGPRVFDSADFPAQFQPEARAHAEILEALRESPAALDWFYVSPAASFGAWNAGERTGAFRVGGDVLMVDEAGESAISGADYAIAYVDELEQNAHNRARMSVAY